MIPVEAAAPCIAASSSSSNTTNPSIKLVKIKKEDYEHSAQKLKFSKRLFHIRLQNFTAWYENQTSSSAMPLFVLSSREIKDAQENFKSKPQFSLLSVFIKQFRHVDLLNNKIKRVFHIFLFFVRSNQFAPPVP